MNDHILRTHKGEILLWDDRDEHLMREMLLFAQGDGVDRTRDPIRAAYLVTYVGDISLVLSKDTSISYEFLQHIRSELAAFSNGWSRAVRSVSERVREMRRYQPEGADKETSR